MDAPVRAPLSHGHGQHREPPDGHGLRELLLESQGWGRKPRISAVLVPRWAAEPAVGFVLLFTIAEGAVAIVAVVPMFGLPLCHYIANGDATQRSGSRGLKRSCRIARGKAGHSMATPAMPTCGLRAAARSWDRRAKPRKSHPRQTWMGCSMGWVNVIRTPRSSTNDQRARQLVWDFILGKFYGLLLLNFVFLFFTFRCSVLEIFKKKIPFWF